MSGYVDGFLSVKASKKMVNGQESGAIQIFRWSLNWVVLFGTGGFADRVIANSFECNMCDVDFKAIYDDIIFLH